jgi:DNA-binding XRE family transcriptional regulator
MSEHPPNSPQSLAAKIARLVRERGWNQEDFARIAQLNRQTVHTIMNEGNRKLRNATVSACARALGLPVHDLYNLPVERLLARINGQAAAGSDEALRALYEKASQPELLAWVERNPERARRLTPAEIDELLALQGAGGPLTGFGVERFVELLERKRRLIGQVQAIAGTEYMDMLEKLVGLIYEKVQPYGDRA